MAERVIMQINKGKGWMTLSTLGFQPNKLIRKGERVEFTTMDKAMEWLRDEFYGYPTPQQGVEQVRFQRILVSTPSEHIDISGHVHRSSS